MLEGIHWRWFDFKYRVHNSDESPFGESFGSFQRSRQSSSTATDPEVQEACVLPTGKEVLYRLKGQNQETKQILDMDPNGKFTHSRYSELQVISDEALCHISFYCTIL